MDLDLRLTCDDAAHLHLRDIVPGGILEDFRLITSGDLLVETIVFDLAWRSERASE